MAATVPFVDLGAQYASIRNEIDNAIASVIERSAFIQGVEVAAFEREFADYCGAQACASVGNGTDALYIALRALGIGPGDEVITVAHTFIATTEAISHCGARPVLVDIDKDTMLLDPARLETAITPRTKAIVPVHLYGQICDMDAILPLARRHGVKVVEDAAQAHGATWRGQRVGSIGDVTCFSFYPSKNLGAFGDAGAIVSNNVAFIEVARMLANHGRHTKYIHLREGVSSRLDGLQAAILRAKLRHLDNWNAARRRIAYRYLSALGECGVELPETRQECDPVWHLFVIRVPNRDSLQAALKLQSVETGVHYPCPLHLQPAYHALGIPKGSLPVTERIAGRVLSLPMFPEMTEAQTNLVIAAVANAMAEATQTAAN